MKIKTIHSSFFWGTLLATLLAGCAPVGPNYQPPAVQLSENWQEQADVVTKQALESDKLSRWWQQLEDPVLDDLIIQAFDNNLDLEAAKSRVRAARARYGMSDASFFPVIDNNTGFQQQRKSGEVYSSHSTSELYKIGFDAAWELDLFGGVRRSVEAAQADVKGEEAGLLNVLVSLSAEVAGAYMELRSYQTRYDLAVKNQKLQQESYELTASRYDAGLTDDHSVEQAKYNLARTSSVLPDLQYGISASKNRISLLLGKQPGHVDAMVGSVVSLPVTNIKLAVGVPAEALRQRPDIQKAEQQLVAQTARVGVATAELYPKFKLIGSIGLESLEISRLFSGQSDAWSWGPAISWRIFDGGRIRNGIKVESELQRQALLNYESTLLTALMEVENAISKYSRMQYKIEELEKAVAASGKSEEFAMSKYIAGLAPYSIVIEAQHDLFVLEDQLADSRGQTVIDLVALYKALGGGWQSYALLKESEE